MEIRDNKDFCIITPLCNILEGKRIAKIFDRIKTETRRVAIDLNHVQNCSIEFIEALNSVQTKKIGIFNIPSDIFVLFNIMNIDKNLNLFVSELDFEENSRKLINRRFTVL